VQVRLIGKTVRGERPDPVLLEDRQKRVISQQRGLFGDRRNELLLRKYGEAREETVDVGETLT